MMGWMRRPVGSVGRMGWLVPLASLLLLLTACDRNVAPFEEEEPSEPDLGAIFPEGAKRAAQPGPDVPPELGGGGAPPAAPGSAGDPVRGTITLGEGMETPPGAVLFIIARRGESGPPLAVKRIVGAEFPLVFELGPDDRMIAAMPFTGPFGVSARIDGDGNAMSRSPGDLQGAVDGDVNPGDTGLELVLDEKL